MLNTINQLKEYIENNKENLSKEELLNKISDLQKKAKYGLIFEDKPEHVNEMLETNFTILKEQKDKEIFIDKNINTNILIEGDNLHALNVLQYTHKEKIDIIYIDPPYNTKNGELTYNDKKIGKDDYWRHSIWCSFMKKRLEKAHELLAEDGIIFISIDENEFAQLKLLCDQIFGEQEFISNLIWQCKYTVSNDKNGITSQTEYILVYGKNSSKINFKSKELRKEYVDKTYKNPDNDSRGPWRTVQLYKKKNPKSYTVTSPTGKEWTMPWNYNEEGFKNLLEDNLVYWGKDGNAQPQKKVFLSDSKGTSHKNLLLGAEVGYTGDGGNEFEKILKNRNLFSYPKPTLLIKELLNMIDKENAIVLDFFAGSGTTGQAVLELNKEDGGNRQFILCTNNEEIHANKKPIGKYICEDVTYPRLQYAINENPCNLKYMKCEYLSKDGLFDKTARGIELAGNVTEIISIKENVFNVKKEHHDYILLENNNKEVMIITNKYLMDFEIEENGYLKEFNNNKEKVLYLNTQNTMSNGIQVKELMM